MGESAVSKEVYGLTWRSRSVYVPWFGISQLHHHPRSYLAGWESTVMVISLGLGFRLKSSPLTVLFSPGTESVTCLWSATWAVSPAEPNESTAKSDIDLALAEPWFS